MSSEEIWRYSQHTERTHPTSTVAYPPLLLYRSPTKKGDRLSFQEFIFAFAQWLGLMEDEDDGASIWSQSQRQSRPVTRETSRDAAGAAAAAAASAAAGTSASSAIAADRLATNGGGEIERLI